MNNGSNSTTSKNYIIIFVLALLFLIMVISFPAFEKDGYNSDNVDFVYLFGIPLTIIILFNIPHLFISKNPNLSLKIYLYSTYTTLAIIAILYFSSFIVNESNQYTILGIGLIGGITFLVAFITGIISLIISFKNKFNPQNL